MAINFIKNIAQNTKDNFTHHSFIRYGPGEFVKEPLKIKISNKDIKISGGFEYVNVFARFLAKIATGEIEVSGAIPTAKEITSTLEDYGLEHSEKNRFGKKGALYTVSGTLSKENAAKLFDELYNCYLLLDLNAGKDQLKIKKKETPKIGKEPTDFAKLTLSKDHIKQVVEEFLFDVDVKDFKEAEISHIYRIEDIKVDEKLVEEDPARAREEAVRIGKIKRTVKIDGTETVKEYKLEA